MNNLTVEQVHAVLEYKNGELIWKIPTGPRVRAGDFAGASISTTGYRSLQLFGKTYKAHTIIYFMFTGVLEKEIDHINNIRHDNRIENLRPVTRAQNCANQLTQKRSASGFKGVSFMPKTNKWRARIKVNQEEIYLGVFDDKEDAAEAYNMAVELNFGKFAKLNTLNTTL